MLTAVVILGAVLDSGGFDGSVMMRPSHSATLSALPSTVSWPTIRVSWLRATLILWTLLMALGMVVGLEPEFFAHLMSLLCALAAYGVVYVGVGSEREMSGSLGGVAAVIWMALCSHLRVFSTSGLETSSYWLCVAVVSIGVLKHRPTWVLLGGSLAFLSRPEGALFALVGALALPAGKAKRQSLLLGGSIAVAYALWKLWYFGDLLPNTYYAKATGDNWGQGATYLWLHARGYVAYVLIPYLWWGLRRERPRFVVYAGLCAAVYLLHIWKAGGGFMVGRLLLPLVPLAAICVGRWVNQRGLPILQVVLIGLLGEILVS